MPSGEAFTKIFYPKYSPLPYENGVTEITGNIWSDFATAVLCQSIYWQTSSAKHNVDINKVDAAVTGFNNSLRNRAVAWYAYVMCHDYMKYQGDLVSAKTTYIKQLDTASWVSFKQKQLTDGSWSNPDWELFHHWVKLSALGASDSEISSLISSLKKRGLTIYDDVDAGNWRNYFVWYQPGNLDHKDVDDDAKGGELESTDNVSLHGPGLSIPEGNSSEFLGDSQPGNKYLNSPSSSCFTSNTQILMSTDAVKSIKEVKAGDYVQTPTGVRKVLMVSTPMRGDRYMYRMNDLPFCFTEAHPFLSFSGSPRYLAASPLALLNNVPLLGQDGIGQLQEGTELLAHHKSKITVTNLQKVRPEKEDEFVYDLIIEPDSNGKFEYIAGAANALFVVASELSTITDYTKSEQQAFEVIMGMILNSAEKLDPLYNSSDHKTFLIKMKSIARHIKGGFLPGALNGRDRRSSSINPEGLSLPELITAATRVCQTEEGTYSQARGTAYDYFMQELFSPIASSLELGFRVVPYSNNLETLVISIMDFHVVDSAPKIPSSPIIIVHAPDHAPVSEKGEENGKSKFGRRFHKSFYLPIKEEDHDVLIELFCPEVREVLLKATLFVRPTLNHGCIHQCLPLFDEGRVQLGYINVDTRILSADHISIEADQARLAWDENSREDLSLRIQKFGEDVLVSLCERMQGVNNY